jgi:hypothetical protein
MLEDMPIIDDIQPEPNGNSGTPQIDPGILLSLLSKLNNGESKQEQSPLSNILGLLQQNNHNAKPDMNDIMLKFLLSGGLKTLFPQKPKDTEPSKIRTINLDNYTRIDT